MTNTKRHAVATITEQQFTNSLLEWAKAYGWRRFHVRNSGYHGVSQVQGDKGFPDLVLVRPPRLIFAELKVGKAGTVKGDPTTEQWVWLNDLTMPGHEIYVWRPDQWTDVLRVLAR